MVSRALTHLMVLQKEWEKDHLTGFVAKPMKNGNGTLNLYKWECSIPGKKGTYWERGTYKLYMTFTDDYPTSPPTCKFQKPIYHPNVDSLGTLRLSILDENSSWFSLYSIKDILRYIQHVLWKPEFDQEFVQNDRLELYFNYPELYSKIIRMEAKYLVWDH